MGQITPEQIRNRAANACVTMDALFTRADVRASTFWRWERGDHVARPLTVAKLRKALEAIETENGQ